MKNIDYSKFFGDIKNAKHDFIVSGDELNTDILFYAYTNGVFPWSSEPVRWYCLEPRAIFNLDKLHFSRTIHRKIRKNIYNITFNRAFREVITCCSYRKEGTWISNTLISAYQQFHLDGFAHSVEAWNHKNELVGGVYGVGIGKFFAGESMFSFQSDAGKIALYHLFEILKKNQFILFDTQQLNLVTMNIGAFEIPKKLYLEKLKIAVSKKPLKHCF